MKWTRSPTTTNSSDYLGRVYDLQQRISVAYREVEKWRGRAERVLGRLEEVKRENERLLGDNVRLSSELVALATKMAAAPAPPQVDVASILDQFRRTISPDVVVNAKPDRGDEQRAGIVWGDQGLDNAGGTPEDNTPEHERERSLVPDYVLDIEKLDPDQFKGKSGGWYNPPK